MAGTRSRPMISRREPDDLAARVRAIEYELSDVARLLLELQGALHAIRLKAISARIDLDTVRHVFARPAPRLSTTRRST
jgi:hypothetical protein